MATASRESQLTTSTNRNVGPMDEPVPVASLLESTAGKCHLMAETLRKKEKLYKSNQNGIIDCSIDDRSAYLALLEDNIRLRALCQDDIDSNKRWLQWSAQRDAHIKKLMDGTRDQISVKAIATAPESIVDNVELQALKAENSRLVEELQRKSREAEANGKMITKLKQMMENIKAEHREHIEVLEMQVRAHRDDWDAERREKIETENREVELKEQLMLAQSKIRELELALDDLEACKCQCHHSKPNDGPVTEPIIRNYRGARDYKYHSNSTRLIPRGAEKYRITIGQHMNADFVTPDGKTNSNPSSPDAETSSTANSDKNKSLQCPECGKVFPEHVHLHFLEHFERCHRRTIL